MLHPVFSALVHRPDLLVDHVSAYAALIQQEAAGMGGDLVTRAVAWALVAIGALVFLVLAGVALMLGFLMDQFQWVLVLVPGAVLLITLVALARARSASPSERFAELKAQFKNDVQALRSVA